MLQQICLIHQLNYVMKEIYMYEKRYIKYIFTNTTEQINISYSQTGASVETALRRKLRNFFKYCSFFHPNMYTLLNICNKVCCHITFN